LMLVHPTLRDWLSKRKSGDSTKFLCDPKLGHDAIALSIIQQAKTLKAEKVLTLVHHILKSNLYKNISQEIRLKTRDLQSYLLAMATEEVSSALSCAKNIFSPILKVSRLLLLSGANPNQVTDYMDNCPLLGMHAYKGNSDMVSLLLEFGADPNATNDKKVAPLALASGAGHLDVVEVLIRCGAKVESVDVEGLCALVMAGKEGHINVIEFLVSIDWQESMEEASLTLEEALQQTIVASILQSHPKVMDLMLDLPNVDINTPDSLHGLSPISAACISGSLACLEILTSRGADSNVRNNRGKTPLMVAAIQGHVQLIDTLVNNGANMELSDSDFFTPLSHAIVNDKEAFAENLLRKGASVNNIDNAGRSPLDIAVCHGNPNLVDVLLEKGADMERFDIRGMKPLDRALDLGYSPVVSVFLKQGARLGPSTWNIAEGKPELQMILLNKLLDDGNTLYRKNKFVDAAIRYNYAIKRLPKAPSRWEDPMSIIEVALYLNLSRCERRQGNNKRAIDLATKIINLYPESVEAFVARGKALKASGYAREAFYDFSSALENDPKNKSIERSLKRMREEMNSQNHVVELLNGFGSSQSIMYIDDCSTAYSSSNV